MNIGAKIRSVQVGSDLKPYLYYTVYCTESIDAKIRLTTRFQMSFDDNMNLKLVARINDMHVPVITVVDSTDKKLHLLKWLYLCSAYKGFFLEKKYTDTGIVKTFKDHMESKFVRFSPDNFDKISASVIANTRW